MVRTKNQPQYKPRGSSTPNAGILIDLSQFSDSVDGLSSISFDSFDNLLDYSSSVQSISSDYEENFNCFPKLSFQRICKEILLGIGNYRFKLEAVNALQIMSEEYLIELFHYSQLIATHAKRNTIMAKDLKLAVRLLSARTNSENQE